MEPLLRGLPRRRRLRGCGSLPRADRPGPAAGVGALLALLAADAELRARGSSSLAWGIARSRSQRCGSSARTAGSAARLVVGAACVRRDDGRRLPGDGQARPFLPLRKSPRPPVGRRARCGDRRDPDAQLSRPSRRSSSSSSSIRASTRSARSRTTRRVAATAAISISGACRSRFSCPRSFSFRCAWSGWRCSCVRAVRRRSSRAGRTRELRLLVEMTIASCGLVIGYAASTLSGSPHLRYGFARDFLLAALLADDRRRRARRDCAVARARATSERAVGIVGDRLRPRRPSPPWSSWSRRASYARSSGLPRLESRHLAAVELRRASAPAIAARSRSTLALRPAVGSRFRRRRH